ncbi:MAG: transcription antitermination regulator [Mycobacterium sp.]|jgi:hypothetical protein|nr:transcription antitermination regulator [Mycobacterium sp.]MDT5214678.1 hypothetical protein [Mycobacterium sp.]
MERKEFGLPTDDKDGRVPDERIFQTSVSDAVAEIAARRAIIEQAKGMLMLVYGITSDAAFSLLKWRSQETNTKLRAIAEQMVVDFQAFNADHGPVARDGFNALLMTGHARAPRDDSGTESPAPRAESA